MITYKTVCKIYHSILYLTFLSSEFIDTALVTFADTVFVIFVAFFDKLSAAFTILSHVITESSVKIAKYSLFKYNLQI